MYNLFVMLRVFKADQRVPLANGTYFLDVKDDKPLQRGHSHIPDVTCSSLRYLLLHVLLTMSGDGAIRYQREKLYRYSVVQKYAKCSKQPY